ncbi:MAG: hypothetical protein JWP63_4612 [Candidatus Solibacter sp.]|nr:hypothetical protein [Candidatus Solibacter sp.]
MAVGRRGVGAVRGKLGAAFLGWHEAYDGECGFPRRDAEENTQRKANSVMKTF